MHADSTVSCVSFSVIHLLAIVLDIGLILVGCVLLMFWANFLAGVMSGDCNQPIQASEKEEK
jgi:hypothetical protein